MRKSIFGGLAAAALLAVSCSVEEQKAQLDNEAVVSFSIALDHQIDTRAISDGNGVDQLMYAVFNEDGTKLVRSKVTIDGAADMIGRNHTNGGYVDVTLPKGKTYQFVFWAQSSECYAYTVSDDMKVTVDCEGLNNDETRDAFFGVTLPFKLNSHLSKDIVLKRPFAQVNVGTDESELAFAKELGIDVAYSSATIKGVADQINLLDGTISGDVDVTYTASAIPSEALYVDVDNDSNKEVYEYVLHKKRSKRRCYCHEQRLV